jgi:hypothetical protein
MTSTDVDLMPMRIRLSFLRRVRELIRDEGGPVDLVPLMCAVDELSGTWISADVVKWLRDRGLIERAGTKTRLTPQAERLLVEMDLLSAQMLAEFEECTYTFSHTRSWCGNPYCREA